MKDREALRRINRQPRDQSRDVTVGLGVFVVGLAGLVMGYGGWFLVVMGWGVWRMSR